MKKKIIFLTVFFILTFTLAQCGGGGTATTFDSAELNDHRAEIQTNSTDAELVIVGTIASIGTAPTFWSGISWSGQGVTYTVNTVLKGTYGDPSIMVYHTLVDGSRQASTESPTVNPLIFALGNKLIVFAKQNANYVDLGEGWEAPLYVDFDENYGTIPYSTQNESVINGMISNPSADLSSTIENTTPSKRASVSKTLVIEGDPADVQSFYNLLDACRSKSTTLENLWQEINNSEAYEVTLNIARNPARVFVDSFSTRTVDIDDLEKWYEGCNQKTDICQLFAHFLQEYWHAAVTGEDYEPSHASALAAENQVRTDLGKTTVVDGHYGLKKDGLSYMESGYDGSTELVKLGGGINPYPESVEVVVTPPAAPTNCTADNSISCQITVAWTDNSSDELGFDVERSVQGSGAWEIKYTSSENVTSWTNSKAADPSLVLDTMYCYRVRSWKPDGMGGYTYSAYCTEACAKKQ